MKIKRSTRIIGKRGAGRAAFTLIEVLFAGAIAGLILAGMFSGYNIASRRAQFSACSLAASTLAMEKLEQVTSATWLSAYGSSWNTTYSNYLQLFDPSLTVTTATNLWLPSAAGNVVNCTNYTSVTVISGAAPYAMIKVYCVWTFPSYGGVFTNTVATLRAPNL